MIDWARLAGLNQPGASQSAKRDFMRKKQKPKTVPKPKPRKKKMPENKKAEAKKEEAKAEAEAKREAGKEELKEVLGTENVRRSDTEQSIIDTYGSDPSKYKEGTRERELVESLPEHQAKKREEEEKKKK
jgi:hypothetical protein